MSKNEPPDSQALTYAPCAPAHPARLRASLAFALLLSLTACELPPVLEGAAPKRRARPRARQAPAEPPPETAPEPPPRPVLQKTTGQVRAVEGRSLILEDGRRLLLAGESFKRQLRPGDRVILTLRDGLVIDLDRLPAQADQGPRQIPKIPPEGSKILIDGILGIARGATNAGTKDQRLIVDVLQGSEVLGRVFLPLRETTQLTVLSRSSDSKTSAAPAQKAEGAASSPARPSKSADLQIIVSDEDRAALELRVLRWSVTPRREASSGIEALDIALEVQLHNLRDQSLTGLQMSLETSRGEGPYQIRSLRFLRPSEAIAPGATRTVELQLRLVEPRIDAARLKLSGLRWSS